MATLGEPSIQISCRHLVRFGDTDLFPPLPEIAFVKDYETEISAALSKVEPGSYTAKTAISSLAPKGRLGFRSAHQLGLTDNLLLLASVIEIGPEIEKLRLPADALAAFSYRFSPQENGEIFSDGRSFRDWMAVQKSSLEAEPGPVSASQEEAIAALTSFLYEDHEPSAEDISSLQSLNLTELLEAELQKDEIDFVKVKRLLRGIRVVTPEASLDLIKKHFHLLLPMAKEIVLILEEVKKTEPSKVDSFKEDFMKFYNEPPAINIAIIRAWLMEAFTRGIFSLQISDLKILNNISTPLDVRQNYLLQGKLDRRTFFRNKKFELDSISLTNRFSFLIGATCLPREELKPFLDTVKKNTPDPLMPAFCSWLLAKHGEVLRT